MMFGLVFCINKETLKFGALLFFCGLVFQFCLWLYDAVREDE